MITHLQATILSTYKLLFRAHYINVFLRNAYLRDLMMKRDLLHRLPCLTIVELISWWAIMS